jgi:hypothetical protein
LRVDTPQHFLGALLVEDRACGIGQPAGKLVDDFVAQRDADPQAAVP